MKKILLIVCLLSFFLFIGCTEDFNRKEFCESIGYTDWNWVNHISDNNEFFCFKLDCRNVTTSRAFWGKDDALNHRCSNYKIDSECLGNEIPKKKYSSPKCAEWCNKNNEYNQEMCAHNCKILN